MTTYTYWEITATIDGEKDTLYGSFLHDECKTELEDEKRSWQDEGYKRLAISSRQVEQGPNLEAYDNITDKQKLFKCQAPSFNFELDAEQLVEKGLEAGYITPLDGCEGFYVINEEY